MTERARNAICVAAPLASGAFLLAYACGLFGAPAPLPRPGPRLVKRLWPADLAGRWTLRWGGVEGACRLRPDGKWECGWCGRRYAGAWRLGVEDASGVDRYGGPEVPKAAAVLRVSERDGAGPPYELRWRVILLPRGGGRFDRDRLCGWVVGDDGRLSVPFALTRKKR